VAQVPWQFSARISISWLLGEEAALRPRPHPRICTRAWRRAYTCKDRVEGTNGGWQLAGSCHPLAEFDD
jgi:hypothetical protein